MDKFNLLDIQGVVMHPFHKMAAIEVETMDREWVLIRNLWDLDILEVARSYTIQMETFQILIVNFMLESQQHSMFVKELEVALDQDPKM